MKEDTGDIASVRKGLRLDVDTVDSVALEGGDDADNLELVYNNPGELVEEDLA